MKFLFDYVKKNMTWDNDESIYSYDGINTAFEKKTSSTGDINLLLTCLLNKADVKASPILFSTRDNGLVKKAFPFISQFNIVMSYVAIANKYFVLDASDRVTHYKLPPSKIVNTNGFIVEGENGRWVEILSGKNKYKVISAVQGEISSDGILKGNCMVNCYDYARVQRCESLVHNRDKFREDYFIKPYSFCKIDDLTINNTETDSLPLEQKIKFSSVLNSSAPRGAAPLARMDVGTGMLDALSGRDHEVIAGSVSADGRRAAVTFGSLRSAGELCVVGLATRSRTTLFDPNAELLAAAGLGEVEELNWTMPDGVAVQGWVVGSTRPCLGLNKRPRSSRSHSRIRTWARVRASGSLEKSGVVACCV